MTVHDRASSLAAIESLVAQANEHQNDPDRFVPLHTRDVSIVNVAGIRVSGRDRFEALMRQALTSRLADVITRIEVDDVTFIRPDVALVACTKHIDDRNADGEEVPTRLGRLTYLVVDDGDGWRIALAQTTPVAT